MIGFRAERVPTMWIANFQLTGGSKGTGLLSTPKITWTTPP